MKQIHSDIVHIVRDEDNFDKPPTCDALITNKLDTPLMVMVADCSPILFYDDRQKVIAVAHAGRAGAFKNIIKNVIDSMKENFNSSASSLHVAIGASIGACCYDVGQEIYDEAQDLKLEYAFEINDNKYYLNIKEILKKQLLACGAKSENIEISEECTCCLKYKYFSYRADKRCGREAGVIKLNS
jgi:YfiH family protein